MTGSEPVLGALPRGLARDNPECGVNALYILLKMHDIQCSREAVKSQLPLTHKGATMLDLKGAAGNFGFSAIVVQIAPDQSEKHVPFIARLKTTPVADDSEGHYVVVTRVTDEVVDMLDSTSGGFVTAPRPTFDREFSGYALISQPSQDPLILWVQVALGIICVLEVLAMTWLAWSRNPPRRTALLTSASSKGATP